MAAHFTNMGQAPSTLLGFTCGDVLIDAEAQVDGIVDALESSLGRVFTKCAHLHNALYTILITPNHIDHSRAVRDVITSGLTREDCINSGSTGNSPYGGDDQSLAKLTTLRRTSS